MRNKIIFPVLLLTLSVMYGCKKEVYPGKYPGGVVSSFISIFDVRNLYKGSDVTLSTENMYGASKITATVISDHSGNNVPAGLVVLQDNRRLGLMRGIAVDLGADAATYVPGDSLTIDVTGTVLKRVNDILTITNVDKSKVTKVASNAAVRVTEVKSNAIVANPQAYECVLVSILSVGFDPNYPAGTTYAGDKTINDGFGNMILHTEAAAPWANNTLPFLSNFKGIIFEKGGEAQLWPRIVDDIFIRAATPPKIAPIVITGYLVDPNGGDGNYEYVQLMATKDIDFSVNNFSMVTTNNAGASTPTGYPVDGWATGGQRTYKIDMTSGTVTKGQYFYVGGNKNIWGSGSTDISSSFWISKLYASQAGDGFGTATSNLLANSGNGAGIAIFDLTNVTADTMPVDVIFYGGAGQLYTAGPPARGYRITNTDYYDVYHPTTQEHQPFYTQGSNTGKLAFPAATYFTQLGGRYNTTTGRWTTARTLTGIPLTATSTVAEIEGATTLE